MSIFSGLLGIFVIGYLIVLGLLWLFIPFAIFGTKNRLDTIIVELEKQNEHPKRSRYLHFGETGGTLKGTENRPKKDARF